MEYEILDFYDNLLEYGSKDIKRAIEIFREVGKTGGDLAEEVKRYSEETGQNFNNIDVVWVALETILQEARNKIEEVLGIDILNDIESDMYVYGNYMCSSYDNYEETARVLKEKIKKAGKEAEEELKEDKVINWFLKEIEVF